MEARTDQVVGRGLQAVQSRSGRKEGQSNAQIALRYVLSFGDVSTTIPGMLTDEHVAENVVASDMGSFPASVLEGFADIYRQHNFFYR